MAVGYGRPARRGTVNRRIAELTDRLDAHTRFQAGIQAARRGWL